MSAIILLLCFIGCALSGPAFWSADFTQNAVASTGLGAIGVNSGKMQFNWNTKNFSIVYAGDQWAEYYQYNAWSGETNSSGQKLSTYGGTCTPTCGVSQLSTAMPPLGLSTGVPSTGRLSARGALIANSCYLYTPTTSTIVANFTMKDDGTVCTVTFKDNRVFVLTNWVGTAPTFNIPANCSCKGKADIWIMVDHSSSIDDTEMGKFKNTFVKPFLDKLAINSEEINVGMSWFNLKTGLNFALTGDRGNVNSGLNAWFTNCSKYSDTSVLEGCQYGSTATATALVGFTPGGSNPNCNKISGNGQPVQNTKDYTRIVGAIEWFMAQSNRGVPRIFITLTDGAMNTKMVPYTSSCNRNSCSFDGCNNKDTSTAGWDLTRAVNQLIAASKANKGSSPTVLPLTLVSVGIGPSCTNDVNQCISPNHLKTLAGNNTDNVININSGFDATALANAVNNLVLLSCPESNNQQTATCIAGCCGLCVCGICKPPATCAPNTNICTQTSLSGSCCVATTVGVPNPCGTPANQCNKTFCNATLNNGQGLCTWGSIDCSGSSVGCEKRNCAPATGQCTVPDRTSCPPIPCTYGPWGDWSACPVGCGGGTISRTRSINQTAADGGAACDPNQSNQTIPCNTQCCPVACTWNNWGGFNTCTKTCGTGTQTRTRSSNGATCNGAPCSGPTSDTQDCNTQCCPVDCTWNNWGGFNTCTKTCGTGTQTRTRTTNDAICGGESCDGPTSETQNCQTNPCPIPCVGAWTSWQTYCPCNGTSLTSTVYRYFTITTPAQYGGANCSFNDGVNQSQSCPNPDCAGGTINCVGRNVTTNCTCANPFRTRTYFIDQIASGPGAIPCPETPGLKETIPCNCTEGSVDNCKCPINCKSNFTEWGSCSCLTQTQNRTYIIYKNSSFGGINCTYAQNNTFLTQPCTPVCPVPCVGAWTNGTCNCTSGNKTDRFGVTTPARDGGAPCPFADGALRSNPCTTTQQGLCPTPCVGAWSQWSTCNCDYGNQTRTFKITKNATNGGAACLRPNNTIGNQVCTPTGCPPANPKCVNASQCSDGNKCTLDRCVLQPSGISRCDWTQNVVCNDNSICTVDTCDPLKGCLFTLNVFCNDNSVCTNESCHPTKGCQYTKKVCPDKDICFLGSCNPTTGCNTIARPCNKTSNCTESKCDVNYTKNGRTGPCYEDFICPFDFGLIAGISAGAAVAIALAAGVVTLAVVGGGSYALASQVTTDDETIITKNPMFQSSGLQGTSPLNELN